MLKIICISLFLFAYECLANDYSSCGTNKLSIELAQLIINSNKQNRKVLSCNKKLSEIASLKAKELSKKDKIKHSIDNISPNQFLRQHGVKLPSGYEYIGNQVEAIQGGMQTAQEAFEYFLTSEEHRAQILAENNFYQSQNQIGVGHYLDKQKIYEDFWVVYITKLRDKDDKTSTNKKIKLVFVKPTQSKKTLKLSAKERRENRTRDSSINLTRTKL